MGARRPPPAVPLPGALIREARERKGWEPAELAVALGVSVRTVRRWEAGQRSPGRVLAARIVLVLGIDPAALVAALTRP